jgi:hypothetical protein
MSHMYGRLGNPTALSLVQSRGGEILVVDDAIAEDKRGVDSW